MQLYPPVYYDDDANGYTQIRTVPLAGAMGAEIKGVDLSDLGDEQFEQIKSALFRYKMIYFRDQDISIEDQETFTKRFGEFGTDAYTSGMPGHPNVQRLLKEASTVVKNVFGAGWHTDSPFMARPPAISLLYGVDIPPYGGDTWWCNTELAYNFLSDTMKNILADLKVHMSASYVLRNVVQSTAQGEQKVGEMNLDLDKQRMIDGAYHPIVRTHPVTGNKSLYVEHTYSMGIEGLDDDEARSLLHFLQGHVTREEFCCRLRWQKNTFVLWDNRICIHKAYNDYDGYRREMYRTIVDGEVPV
jgi:alpha-ketoglutarate-dependent taurine dioxygenase